MRRILFSIALVTLFATRASAGVPAPSRSACGQADAGVPHPAFSGCALAGQVAPCQFRFRADGALDVVSLKVTVRDCFDTPCAACTTTATLHVVGGAPEELCYVAEQGASLCACGPFDPIEVTGRTGANGVVNLVFDRLGGRGSAVVCATTRCVGNIEICCKEFLYTSADLVADCNSGANVIDLGVWAACLPPAAPCRTSDFNCDCAVNVIDLGLWAGGLGEGCR